MPDRLADIREQIARAQAEIREVAEQGPARRWRITTPSRPDWDTDRIVGDALRAAEDLAAEVERLNAQFAAINRMNRVADGDWEREVERLKAENTALRSRGEAADWTIRQALAEVEHEEAVHVLNRYVTAADAEKGGAR